MTMTATKILSGRTGEHVRVYTIACGATNDASVTIAPPATSQVPVAVFVQAAQTTQFGSNSATTNDAAGLWSASINATTGVVTVERTTTETTTSWTTTTDNGLARVMIWDDIPGT